MIYFQVIYDNRLDRKNRYVQNASIDAMNINTIKLKPLN